MPAVRRLLRIAFNVLTVLSLVLAGPVAGLWVRSYFVSDYAWYSSPSSKIGVITERGAFAVFRSVGPRPTDEFEWYFSNWPATENPKRAEIWERVHLNFAGALLTTSATAYGPSGFYFRLSCWVPAMLVVAGASRFGRWIVRRWSDLGAREGQCCAACGYDLRATPDRCPECGEVAAEA